MNVEARLDIRRTEDPQRKKFDLICFIRSTGFESIRAIQYDFILKDKETRGFF